MSKALYHLPEHIEAIEKGRERETDSFKSEAFYASKS